MDESCAVYSPEADSYMYALSFIAKLLKAEHNGMKLRSLLLLSVAMKFVVVTFSNGLGIPLS